MLNVGDVVKFEQDNLILDVNVSPNEDTVWLSKEDMSTLFDRDRSVITKHINNIYKEGELDRESTCAKNAHVHLEGSRTITRTIEFYNLDVINNRRRFNRRCYSHRNKRCRAFFYRYGCTRQSN